MYVVVICLVAVQMDADVLLCTIVFNVFVKHTCYINKPACLLLKAVFNKYFHPHCMVFCIS
ncbi:hypothetical protein DPEC_G00042160, partial [Dallia pectoralis]